MSEPQKKLLVYIRCPELGCEKLPQQSAMFARTELQEIADGKAEARVFGATCGHDWLLSAKEVANIRRRLADGSL